MIRLEELATVRPDDLDMDVIRRVAMILAHIETRPAGCVAETSSYLEHSTTQEAVA